MSLQSNLIQNIFISRLSDVPSFAPALASAHAREWGHLYANWNESVALADFRMENESLDLSATWVIHNHAKAVMGSISLVKDDLPNFPDLNPWLASLLVFPEFQGHGLGKILVQKALDNVRHHRHQHAFLFTEDKVSFFSKFNFSVHGSASAQGHKVTIMRWTAPEPIENSVAESFCV